MGVDKPLVTNDNGHELAKRGTDMNRQQYRLAYREARKAIRFYGDMKDATGAKVTSMFDTLDLCPKFEICRLHPDTLRLYVGHLGQITHQRRMNHLRQRVRLPA